MAADSDSLRFGCPKCQKRLKAPASLAGSRSRCPYCQTTLDVPHHSRINAPIDVYPLQDGTGSLLGEQPEYVLVVCPVCHARMHPEASQIGQKAICPDCGTSTTVRRPPEKPAKKPQRSADEIGEYPLAEEVHREANVVPAAEQDYVAVVCSLCHTRMLATADQVGGKLICPDCGTATVVPPMPRARPKIDVMAGADRGYGFVGGDAGRPIGSPAASARRTPAESPGERAKPSDDPEFKPPSRRPVLPKRPFLDGTFSFPFYRSVWIRTLLLAIWSILPPLLWWGSMVLGASEQATTAFGSAMLFCAMMLCGMMWFAVLSATVMTVLRETSEGCDEIVNWPGHVFLDWIGEPLHLFCALCTSAVPGAAVAWLLMKLGISTEAVVSITAPVSMFLMFPIVLMSTLEQNSAFGVVSLPVWRTLWTTADVWAKFYAASGVLVAVSAVVPCLASCVNVFVGAIVAAALQTAAWMIYSRLLGRLAWVCADRAAFDELEAELAELDDEDFDEDVDDEDLLK